MAIMFGALQIAKRLGLSKAMTGLLMRRVLSPEINARAFEGYPPSSHDVFVATFAKSGTNWMMQIAQQIAHYGAAEFPHIHAVVPWPDAPGSTPIGDLFDETPIENSPTGLRIIKTHLAAEYIPYSEKAKYLAVIRDPKEVLVSSYYFLGGMFGVLNHLTIDDWFDLTTRPGGLMERWAIHTASVWDWREHPNVLVMNYREIIKEPVASIELVAGVMGVTLSPEQLASVVERSSFSYMQAHEAQFAPPLTPFNKGHDLPKMVRRGKSDGSDEALSSKQQIQIDELCQANLERL
ncbi:MAG: sulfotransferase domain-containing protein, partial [bacterium]|nr:sulfotransferase domain-containing protein [bacterium]